MSTSTLDLSQRFVPVYGILDICLSILDESCIRSFCPSF